MSQSHDFFATCPKGLESLLLDEVQSFGAVTAKETVAGVSFSGPLQLGYRACLWSRLANKVLLPLATSGCHNAEELYEAVKAIEWRDHLDLDGTFAIDFFGNLRDITHSHFGALKAKDAIADYFTEHFGRRPDVNRDVPDVRINVRVHRHQLTVSLDLSGDSLHRRGYRKAGGVAPLKENLAAAILLRADWPGMAARGGALIDPMCGSGTFLIEGALISANIAPGLYRRRWGFDGWQEHVPKVWNELLEEARDIRALSLARQWPEIRGYDSHPRAIGYAEENIDRAGLTGKIRVSRKELAQFVLPTHTEINAGLVITNPPYGERLGEEHSLVHLYRHLGQRLKEQFPGWRAGVFTGNPELGKQMGLRSNKQYQLFNGSIPSKLLMFEVEQEYFVDRRASDDAEQQSSIKPVLTEGASMFANRLRKNQKQLNKWRKKNEVACYRLYDADMPEYAVAVDRYDDWVHVAEYAPPSKVDPEAAEKRLRDVVRAIPSALDVPSSRVVLKQRRRQKGKQQYEKYGEASEFIEVQEGQAKLLVNLKDYLDTGLFLDHRPVRLKIAELAKGKRFLNLFCYTATASVHAALGGAKWTDSVDMSQTYLDWARKNMALNGLSETSNRMIREDVRDWLKNNDSKYDLILLDPPTFSNSKRMEGTLDIQRDHELLLKRAMHCLEPGGLLIFSNNQRNFVLEDGVIERYDVEDKTAWSIDKDFTRNKKIHQCWFIRHKSR
jgi:23S rRNA (guanine2445-N2)-methyltransferase / 23S rRNA (guanine2069-N7)-methyltransferase